MKKASYILLAMMLIIAVFVSCKAEVIDDSDLLVNVTFSSDDNSKGLTWSRDFAPESYYWSYDASKADNGPRTGTATKAKVGGDEGKGLIHDVGPFSVGTWDFTLYGYTDADRTKLVYEGHAQASLAKGSSNPVKVNVSSKDEQAGTILVSKDIRLTDGTNTTYTPTHFSIKNAKDSSPAVDTNSKELKDLEFSTTEDMPCTVKSGSYVVTIEMRNEDGSVVYSSTQIYINVYDYQTTRIGGSLDDVKVSTRFEASDGTIVGTSNETAINTEGPTTLTTPEGVTPVKSGKTTVVFPQGALGTAKKATLKVIASPMRVSSKSCIEWEISPLAGIDLFVFVDGNAVTNFASPVTVTTYVAKGLTSQEIINNASEAEKEGLKVICNGSGDQPTITSYDSTTGKLVFTTSHFSQYYVTSSRIVAVNVDTNVVYTSLKEAVDAVTDSGYITLLKGEDGDGILIPEGNRTLTIDLNGKTYNVVNNFIADKNSGINLGKGNSVILQNGVIASNSKKISTLVQNYSNLRLQDVTLDGLTGGSFGQSVNGDCSVLSCNYGKTVITGTSDIKGRDGNGFKTVSITCLRSDVYNSVSVEFDSNYEGTVYNRVYFDSEKGTSCLSGYTHSLLIEAGNFNNAKFILQEIRGKSLFSMKDSLCFSPLNSASYGVVSKDGYKVLADEVVYNETSDTKYTDFHTAITNSLTGTQLKFVLKGTCFTSRYSTYINGERVVTLDLNGNIIKANEYSDSVPMFAIDDGTLKIVDSSDTNGSIDSSDNSKVPCCIQVESSGSFTVEKGITIKAAVGKKAATGWPNETITEGYSYSSN